MPRQQYFKLTFLLIACLNLYSCRAQFNDTPPAAQVDYTSEMKQTVTYLADPALEGRAAGTAGADTAAAFIKNYLTLYNAGKHQIMSDTFSYCCRGTDTIKAHNIWLWPVDTTKPVVVFTAHYDHLPPGSNYSKEIWNKDKVHPGADDNASGVAMVLALFKYFLVNPQDSFNVAFVFFSGHEEGLYGSSFWIKTHMHYLEKIALLINFDMVGRLDVNSNTISLRTDNVKSFKALADSASTDLNLKATLTDENFIHTDSYIFHTYNIPALTVTSGIHNDYHRITDTAEKINYEGMKRIFTFILKFIKAV